MRENGRLELQFKSKGNLLANQEEPILIHEVQKWSAGRLLPYSREVSLSGLQLIR